MNSSKTDAELAWEFIVAELNRQAMEPLGILGRLESEYPGPSEN